MTDTTEYLQEKIEQVTKDLRELQAEGGNVRKVEALTEYKKYLEDELKRKQEGK
jgi:hypothetical protein